VGNVLTQKHTERGTASIAKGRRIHKDLLIKQKRHTKRCVFSFAINIS